MAGESKEGFLLSLRSDNDFARVCLLAFLWIVATCLVNPIGDFPLVDDWAYCLMQINVFRPQATKLLNRIRTDGGKTCSQVITSQKDLPRS
jgi:hypothetical protein